jgi:hypothetical protein
VSDLDHFAHNLNAKCSHLSYELRRVGGYFDNIEGRISDGCWSHEFDTTHLNLNTAEATLRSLANEISVLRRRLSENVPQAAE